jgi:flagellar basal-body rod protein FlgC
MIKTSQIALSGIQAASKRVEASASNIANLQTADYTPITAQQTALTDQTGNGQGVRSDFVPKTQPFTPSYDPDSPFANNEGYVNTPNIDLAEEAVNMTIAKTAYKANVSVIETVQDMTKELLAAFDKKA